MDLKLWHDDTDWYWARDLAHLAELIKSHAGDTYEDMAGESVEDSWSEYGPEMFTFSASHRDELPLLIPGGADVRLGQDTSIWSAMASVKAWGTVAEPGFFASTEW